MSVAPAEPTDGAMKVGVSTLRLESVTGGPPVCVHVTLSVAVSGSSLSEPSSTLRRRSGMWRSGPASAIGARLRRKVSPLSV